MVMEWYRLNRIEWIYRAKSFFFLLFRWFFAKSLCNNDAFV